MGTIAFTQYMLPNGRQVPVKIDRPAPIAEKAEAIIKAGFRFECEMLGDMRTVSLTITDPQEGDLDIEVVPNGPEVPVAIDRMIDRFPLPSSETNQL